MDHTKLATSYHKIKNPALAYESIRWWESGRKYDLLRCISTLIYEQYQDSPLIITKKRSMVTNSVSSNQPVSPNSSNSLPSETSSISSDKSNRTTSSTGVIINELLTAMRQDLWKWFQFTGRSLSRSHLTPDTLFDSALMFYRNAKIQDFEKRLLDDQSILEDIVTDVNSLDNNKNRIAIASETAYEVLSGSRFVSLNKIPGHILQKPLSVRQRNPDDKYKAEVEIINDLFRPAYKKRVIRKHNTLVEKTENFEPLRKKKKTHVNPVQMRGSLSCFFD